MSRAALELNYLKTNCNTVTFIPAIYFKKQGKIWVINGINQWNPLNQRKNTKPISLNFKYRTHFFDQQPSWAEICSGWLLESHQAGHSGD